MKRPLVSFFLLLISMAMMGCASTQINLNGAPIVDIYYSLVNPATGIRADFYLTRYFLKDEEGEKVLWPDYLAINEKISLRSDTIGVSVHLMIANPNKVKYQLWESYRIKLKDQSWPSYTRRKIADTKISSRYFKLNCPMVEEEMEVNYGLEVRDEYGSLLFMIGEANYIIKEEEVNQDNLGW